MAARRDRTSFAFSFLNSTFGSPANQKKGWENEDAAAYSAATVLATRGFSMSAALKLVKEWYRG
jgi:hypothetical protein